MYSESILRGKTMLRSLAILLVFIVAASAAPIPKSLLRVRVPDMTGTTWNSDETEADLGIEIYTFKEGGQLSIQATGGSLMSGTWTQDGSTVRYRVNDYVDYEATVTDPNSFEAKAKNQVSRAWTAKLTRVDK